MEACAILWLCSCYILMSRCFPPQHCWSTVWLWRLVWLCKESRSIDCYFSLAPYCQAPLSYAAEGLQLFLFLAYCPTFAFWLLNTKGSVFSLTLLQVPGWPEFELLGKLAPHFVFNTCKAALHVEMFQVLKHRLKSPMMANSLMYCFSSWFLLTSVEHWQ